MTSFDRPFRWGVLSTAPIAANAYVPAIQASTLGRLYAVSSRSPERAEAFAEKHGFVRSHVSHEELLADPEVDGVYNPMPTSFHHEWTLKCLQAGKPVLCEKPLCRTAMEAEEIWRLSEQTGIQAAEALMYIRHPLLLKVQELITSGAIGELRIIESTFHGVDNPDSSRFEPELGGGALYDLGVYCISLSRLLAGEEPNRVAASGWIGPTGVDESVSASLRFPSGVVASVNFGLRLPFCCEYRVSGTEGRISVRDGGMITGPGKERELILEQGNESRRIRVPDVNHYQQTADDFVQAVRGEKEYAPGLEDTIGTLRIMDDVRACILKNH